MLPKALLAVLIVFLCVSATAFAAEETEEITLTTYYPAPYGEYENLQADKLAVGSTAVVSTVDGVINFATITPPTTGTKGDFAFDGSTLKYCDTTGSAYKSFGGAGSNIDFAPGTTGTVQTLSLAGLLWQTVVIDSSTSPATGAILNISYVNGDDSVVGFRTFTGKVDLGIACGQAVGSGANIEKMGDFVIVPLESGKLDIRKDDGDDCTLTIRTIALIR